MKLSINLADREEIAAAVPLLQLILDNTPAKACGGQCHAPVPVEAPQTVFAPAPLVDEPQDPAAVFGGALPATPLAPSIPPAAMPSIAVPPAPAITAPIMPTPGPASLGAGAGSVELDKNGLPWDERIHAGTKRKNADGSWTAKRGVDAAFVTQVEAELRGASAAPVSSVPTPPAPPVPQAAADGPATFEQLMPRITAAVTAGIMPPTAVGAACAAHGVSSVVTLQQNPQFVPLVWATLREQFPELQ